MQRSNGVVSSYRLISVAISATFHTAERHNLTADTGVSHFFREAETTVSQSVSQAVSQSPLLGHDNRKIVSGGCKLILALP
jgi:hypothetical protein